MIIAMPSASQIKLNQNESMQKFEKIKKNINKTIAKYFKKEDLIKTVKNWS